MSSSSLPSDSSSSAESPDEMLEKMYNKYKKTKNELPKVVLWNCQLTELPTMLQESHPSQFYQRVTKLHLPNNPMLFSPATTPTTTTVGTTFQLAHFRHSLTELNLSNNQLTEIPIGIADLCELKSLTLAHNSISQLPPWFFDSSICRFQRSLTNLSLENNQLRSIPTEISQFSNLQTLHLAKNKLSNLPDSILQLTQLKDIILASNPLVRSALEKLNLNTKCSEEGDEKETDETAVEEVSRAVSLFSPQLKQMRFFSINTCSKIRVIPNEITYWTMLEYLFLHDCSVQYIPMGEIARSMPQLRIIMMKGNKIGDDSFMDRATGQYVDLSPLKYLTELDMRNNGNLTQLPPYLHKSVVNIMLPRLKKLRHSFAECIIPNRLYISDKVATTMGKHMKDLKMTHILSVIDRESLPKLASHRLKRHHIDVLDEPTVDLSVYFTEAIQFIEQALMEVQGEEMQEEIVIKPKPKKNGNSVLVHCVVGKSRSASCVIAYLMKTYSLTYDESFAFLNSIRSGGIAPNPSFVAQLRSFESSLSLLENRTIEMTEYNEQNPLIQSVLKHLGTTVKSGDGRRQGTNRTLPKIIVDSLETIYQQAMMKVRCSSVDSQQQQQQAQEQEPNEEGKETTPDSYRMVLIVRDDLHMSKGKITSQCCHATLSLYKHVVQSGTEQQLEWLRQWEAIQETKVVLRAKNYEELAQLLDQAKNMGMAVHEVVDKGRTTQVDSGSITAAAIGPAPCSLMNQITKHLKLI